MLQAATRIVGCLTAMPRRPDGLSSWYQCYACVCSMDSVAHSRRRVMLKFLKENYRWIMGGFLLTYFSSFGQTFFVSGSIAEWRAAFDLSHGDFGRLYMLATLASALCLPFVGRLVDIMPVHRLILLVVPVLAAATLIAAYAPSILILGFGIFLLRLFGKGMMTHSAVTATGRWF